MKVTIEDRKPEEPEVKWEYPCLGISTNNYIVLFTSNSEGICLTANAWYKVFEQGTFWVMEDFKPIKNKRIIIEC